MDETKIISKHDYELYLDGKPSQINVIWQNLLLELPKELAQEAVEKGFNVQEVDKLMDLINIKIVIPDASTALANALESLHPYIICE